MGVEVLYQVVEPEAFEVDARSISDAALTSIAVSLKRMADRAGAAASAERIKELETRVAELEDMASRYLIQMSDMLTRLEERYPEDFVWLKEGDEPTDEARAMLTEPDQ